MSEDFTNNADRSRYEMMENGHLVYASYRITDGQMVIPYVEAAVPLRGTGAADRLMAKVASEARSRGLKVVPLCGYASMWFRRHKEHMDLLG